MSLKLPNLNPTKFNTSNKLPSQTEVNKLDHLVLVVPDTVNNSAWKKLPYGTQLKNLFAKSDNKNSGVAVSSHLPNRALTGVSLGIVQKGRSTFKNLTQMRKLMAETLKTKAENVGLIVFGFSEGTALELNDAISSAALAAGFSLWSAKKRNSKQKRLRSIQLFNTPASFNTDAIKAEAAGNNLSRWLTALPPNALNSGNYIDLVEQLAKRKHWDFECLDILKLSELGAGAFLAVAQGNPHENAGIVHLSYTPKGRNKSEKPDLALVGKGICFDTGGSNLKPHSSMLGMKGDMGGSATALGSFYALTQQKSDKRIDCWLAITENCIDAHAYLPSDVVTACNGTTIEVIHTDAEGRMALADTLSLVSRTKPKLIMDFATLTGAAVYSVTERYSCVFTNRPKLHQTMIDHGVSTGERVWPFPQDDDYDSNLESKVADTLQCSTKSGGDHILAARFLNKFVDNKSAWIHMDLSASENDSGLAHIPTAQTGFGVRYTSRLIQDGKIFDNL